MPALLTRLLVLVRRHVAASSLAVLLVVLLLCTSWVLWFPNPSPDPGGLVIHVHKGASFRTAIDSLDAAGGLRSPWAIRLAGRLFGYDERVYVGRYRFVGGPSNLSVLKGLYYGTARELVRVSIPEGWRFRNIAARSARVLGIDSAEVASLCTDTSFIRSFGIVSESLEGFLLPDTYEFHWQIGEEEVVTTLVRAFQEFYVDSLRSRQEELKLSLNQVLTLASIVEGETSLEEERARVSGVYWNRLKNGMRLDADPTIQYILPDGPRRLTYADLRLDSPYNTYRRRGLPPGPINNPGRASIIATLYPENHRYHYFVATGFGGHTFSRTYAEHLRAVREYRRARRMIQQGSSGS